jgi:hypothetical protein
LKWHGVFISPQLEWLSSRKQATTNAGKNAGTTEPLFIVEGNAN